LKAFQLCRPDIKLPSRKEISGLLLNQSYDDVKNKFDSYLALSPYHCINSYGWSNVKKEPIRNCMIVSHSESLFLDLYGRKKLQSPISFPRYLPHSRETLLIACFRGSHRQ
jgi:hypothetical protein